jgi:hypothetical protein
MNNATITKLAELVRKYPLEDRHSTKVDRRRANRMRVLSPEPPDTLTRADVIAAQIAAFIVAAAKLRDSGVHQPSEIDATTSADDEAAKVIAAGELARAGGPVIPPPPADSVAGMIIAAGRKARGEA